MSLSDNIIEQAKIFCAQHNERLTAPRLEVLKIISATPKPLGAYEILDKLANIMDIPKPPTIYRALEFWQKQGFIHRIESLNAYIICQASHRHQGSQFMICNDCGNVIETHICDLPDSLKENTSKHEFVPSRWNIEIYGHCQECRPI